MSLAERIENNIKNLIKTKIKIDSIKVIKKLGFSLKKEFKIGDKSLVVGNEGKIFDTILLGTNINGDKIVILYNKNKEEPYYLLIDTTSSENLVTLIHDLNNKTIESLKNKGLELSFLQDFILKNL